MDALCFLGTFSQIQTSSDPFFWLMHLLTSVMPLIWRILGLSWEPDDISSLHSLKSQFLICRHIKSKTEILKILKINFRNFPVSSENLSFGMMPPQWRDLTSSFGSQDKILLSF